MTKPKPKEQTGDELTLSVPETREPNIPATVGPVPEPTTPPSPENPNQGPQDSPETGDGTEPTDGLSPEALEAIQAVSAAIKRASAQLQAEFSRLELQWFAARTHFEGTRLRHRDELEQARRLVERTETQFSEFLNRNAGAVFEVRRPVPVEKGIAVRDLYRDLGSLDETAG